MSEQPTTQQTAADKTPGDDQVEIQGKITAVLRGPDGKIKQIEETENLVVTQGRNAIMDQHLTSPTAAKASHMGIGSGTTAPVAGDTNLETVQGTRVAITKGRSNNVLTSDATFAAGNGTASITEAAIFSTATIGAGTATVPMYSRATFTAIPKGASDSLAISWTWTLN